MSMDVNGSARTARRWPLLVIAALAAAAQIAGCREPSPEPAVIRLTELLAPQAEPKDAARAARLRRPGTEWTFAGAPDGAGPQSLQGWSAGPGVAGLEVRGGRLTGKSTDGFPVLHVRRTAGVDATDVLHSVEVRMRASAGSSLAVSFSPAEEVDPAQAAYVGKFFPWRIATPIVAEGELRTYVLKASSNPFRSESSEARHVLLRPTDVAGATFEIESVRLIYRRDFLASVPPGVSWQGLSDVFHETLVSHSPREMRVELKVPERAWLDLSVGTVETRPVTFRVAVRSRREDRGEILLDRTVGAPNQWEPAPVDLSAYGGQTVELALAVSAGEEGALGFWGSPVIRRRLDEETQARGGGGTAEAAADGRRPRGVLLILADTLRRDHLDLYGYGRPTAPVLRRLAGEGALFRDAQVEGTWTKVAAPSLLTGMYPQSLGIRDFEDRVPNAATTLGEAYRDAGYATLSLSSVVFTGRFSNLHQGFDELHEASSLASRRSSKTAKELVDRLVPWLERHREVPFFVLLHVLDPHDPYRPNPPYDTLFADGAQAEEHERQRGVVRELISDPLLQNLAMPSREDVIRAGFDPDTYIRREKDWYDGAIRGMDDQIARLLEELRRLGLDRQVLIAFTSDHGEEFFDHGRMFHGQTVYGELTNVPLFFWGPGHVPAGVVVPETVQGVDLVPTMLDLSGLPIPERVQGRSLKPLMDGGGRTGGRGRPAFSVKAATRDVFGPSPRDTEFYAVVLDGWKLVHHARRPQGGPEYELFDHARDPLNRKDVAAQHPDVVKRLAGVLGDWRRKAEAEKLPSDAQAAAGLSGEELERLRSLGYIQ